MLDERLSDKYSYDLQTDKDFGNDSHIAYSLLLTPYSLLPTPYSLLPTPYSLLLTPYSLLFNDWNGHIIKDTIEDFFDGVTPEP